MKQQKGHLKEQRQADGNGGLKEQRQAGGSGRSSSKNPKREVEMDDDDHHRRRNDKPSMNTSKSIGPARGPPVPEVRKTEKKSSPTQGLSSVKRTVVDLDDDIVDEDVQQQRSPETGVLPQAVDVSTVNKNKPVPQRQGDFLTEQSQDQCNINKGGAFPTSTPAPQTTTMAVLPQACGSAVPIVAMCTRIEPPATQEDYRSNQTRTTTTSVAASSKATSRTPLEKDPVPCASTRRVLILACIVLACIIMLAIGSVLFVVARKNNTKEEGDASNEFHENHARTNDQVLLLESGMALSDQHGLKNEVQLYTIVVPALHSVTCETEGVHGDVDLYLRFHDVPELDFKSSNNACHSVHNRSNEVCTTNSTLSGSEDSLLYVALHAYEAYRDLTLICVVQPLSDTVQIIELHDGVPLHEQHGEEGQIQLYMMPVPSEHTVTCTSIGGNGDVNLFLRFDTHPDTQLVSSNDCHILLSNSDGECTTEPAGNHTGTMIYIALHGQYWNVTLTCTTRSNGASIEANPVEPDLDFGPYTELRNGVSLSNLNGREDDVQIYAMFVPQDHAVTCTTRGNNGDADLFLRFNEPPDLIFFTSNDCESTGFDSNEECTATRPLGSTSSIIYVAVIAFSSYHGLTLACTTEELISWVEIPPMPDQSETDICFLKELDALYCTLSSLAFESSGCLQCATIAIGRWNPLGGEGTDNCASLQGDFCVAMTQCGCGACVNEVANFLACTAMMDECDLVCGSQSSGSTEANPVEPDLDFGPYTELRNGVSLSNLNGREDDVQIYAMFVPQDHAVTCTTRGNNGDADLFLRFNEPPDLIFFTSNDCESTGFDSNEECTATRPLGSTSSIIYVAVIAFSSYHGLTLTCTTEELISWVEIPPMPDQSETDVCFLKELNALYCTLSSLAFESSGCLQCATMAIGRWNPLGGEGTDNCASLQGDFCVAMTQCGCGACVNEVANFLACTVMMDECDLVCRSQSPGSSPTGTNSQGQVIELGNGVPLQNQNGAQRGDVQIYSLTSIPPEHMVTCTTRGNNGDADLYVRFNQLPDLETSSRNDCTSLGWTSNEECIVGPTTGTANHTLYAAVRAAGTYRNVTITCTCTAHQLQGSNGGIPSSDNSSSTESTGNGEFIELESGIPLLNQHGQTEDLHFYTLSVPPEHMVTCITRGDNGDADLFMYFGEDFIDFDCYSFGSSSNEECIVGPSGDIASTLYVIVSASYTYYDVSITCTAQLYQGNNGGSSSSSTSVPTESTGIGQYIELQDGVPLPNQNGLGGDSQIYTMPVPPDHTVTCMTRGNDGDADLSARFNHDSLFSNGCHSIGLDSNEECTTGPSGSTAGTIYVELFAAVSYQDLTITCRTQPYQGSQTSTGPSAGATGLLTEETAPTGAPTQNSPPDPANVISYTLETHNLLFIFQQSRIPNNQDYEELTQLTEDYLNQFFEQVLQQTNDIIFSGSTTELIDRRFLLGQPVRVTYSTTIILSRMSTLLPSEVELTALLISAFRGAQLALYLTAVQALPATNIFQSTSEIEFVQ